MCQQKYLWVIVLILSSSWFVFPAPAATDSQTEYFAVFLAGQKSGYGTNIRTVEPGKITTSESVTITIKRSGVPITIKSTDISIETPYGKVCIKIGSWKGKDITCTPEHDDCVRCAEQHNVPVRTVYESAKFMRS